MKKIVFLIIGTLLVLGLVLPGCGGGADDFDQYITIGIAGPMGAAQGDHHYYGAEMAADEINADGAGGVTVGGLVYGIELVKIDTNEILNPSGADGTTRMEANIANLDFVMGGFRTEAVLAYREVVVGPDGAGKLFINCGAATAALQHSCVLNYTDYKPWFKGTPPNEIFLSLSQGKLLTALVAGAREAAGNDTYEPSIAFMPENALWTAATRGMIFAKYGPGGDDLLVGGPGMDPADYMWMPSPVATTTEMDILLTDIATLDPDIVLMVMSGPCGAIYGQRVAAKLPGVLSYGINVEAMRSEFADLSGAEGMVFLDVWPPGMNYTDKTADFVSDFEDEYDELPIYTAATYDATLSLVEAIEGKDSIATAGIIDWMEDSDNAREGTTGLVAYYPQWDGSTVGTGALGGPFPALTEAQVLELYPWLPNAKFSYDAGSTVSNWTYTPNHWTMPQHDTHDLVYGTEWVTGAASQWQDLGGAKLEKVGIWPRVLDGALPTNLATWIGWMQAGVPGVTDNATLLWYLQDTALLWDQYGWWNFANDGTGDPDITDWVTWLVVNGKITPVP